MSLDPTTASRPALCLSSVTNQSNNDGSDSDQNGMTPSPPGKAKVVVWEHVLSETLADALYGSSEARVPSLPLVFLGVVLFVSSMPLVQNKWQGGRKDGWVEHVGNKVDAVHRGPACRLTRSSSPCHAHQFHYQHQSGWKTKSHRRFLPRSAAMLTGRNRQPPWNPPRCFYL